MLLDHIDKFPMHPNDLPEAHYASAYNDTAPFEQRAYNIAAFAATVPLRFSNKQAPPKAGSHTDLQHASSSGAGAWATLAAPPQATPPSADPLQMLLQMVQSSLAGNNNQPRLQFFAPGGREAQPPFEGHGAAPAPPLIRPRQDHGALMDGPQRAGGMNAEVVQPQRAADHEQHAAAGGGGVVVAAATPQPSPLAGPKGDMGRVNEAEMEAMEKYAREAAAARAQEAVDSAAKGNGKGKSRGGGKGRGRGKGTCDAACAGGKADALKRPAAAVVVPKVTPTVAKATGTKACVVVHADPYKLATKAACKDRTKGAFTTMVYKNTQRRLDETKTSAEDRREILRLSYKKAAKVYDAQK